MKRIIVAAVAAASLASAAPANAQVLDDVQINVHCLTPVTKCVDEAADRAVALVMGVYDAVGDAIKNPPPIGTVCELIWEGGCSDAVPF